MVSFLVLLLIFTLILFVCIGRTFVHKEKLAIPLRKVLFTVILPILANVIIAVSSNELLCQWCYVGYFIGTNWLLLYMINFTRNYCSFRNSHKVFNSIIVLLGLADTISIFLNPLFSHVFTLKTVTFASSATVYYSYTSALGHYIHLAYTLLLVLYLIFMIVIKMVRVSTLYLEKYLVIFFVIMVVVLWDGYYIVSRAPVDQSVLAYSAGAILVYFFTLEYKPVFLKGKMLTQVVENISDAIFFIDDSGNCIYFNHSAETMFKIKPKDFIGAKSIISVLGEAEFFGLEYTSITKEVFDGKKTSTYEVEYRKMYDSVRHIYAGAFISVSDRTKDVAKIARQQFEATHDPLTGIYNADTFCKEAEKLLKANSETKYVLVCSDVSEFKFMNDMFGKTVCESILKNIAELIEYFAQNGSVYGKIGIDRFAVLMPQFRYSEELFVSGLKRLAHFDDEIFYPLVIRIGVFEVSDINLPVQTMIERALLAASSLKNEPKSAIAYYDSNMLESVNWERMISEQLSPALEKGLIIPYLQAQVQRDGRVDGAEILCRWDNTPTGLLTPDNFLEILEKNNSIVKLDSFIWEAACKILKRWKEQGRSEFYLSVNISAKDFLYIDVYERFMELVQKYEIAPGALRLEITETVMMTDFERNVSVLEKLRSAGFIIEMDDFGSGYSSLNMLKNLPVDILKVDMVFLDKVENQDKAKTILKCVVSMANELKIPVIVEGVETVEQLEFLRSIGCDLFQGFYFSRPVALSDFEDIYFSQKK